MSAGECPLCDADDVDAVTTLVDDYWPEDGRPDYLGLKRDLEAEHDISLTVSGLKTHVNEHITWSWSGSGGEEP